jgi:hypothetical protein
MPRVLESWKFDVDESSFFKRPLSAGVKDQTLLKPTHRGYDYRYREPSADRIVLLTTPKIGVDCDLLSRSRRFTLITSDASSFST